VLRAVGAHWEIRGYSDLTTDTRAAAGPSAVFRTHGDSIHMGHELAKQIVDSLGAGSCSTRLEGGTLLSKRTINSYLELVEARRDRFARANPSFMADAAALARTFPHRAEILNPARP